MKEMENNMKEMENNMKEMDSENLFSIVILTYNRKNKLIRLIDSILFSTTLNRIKEIIIYNNNSTDATIQELNNRFGKNDKIKIYDFPKNTRNRAKRWNFMLNRSFFTDDILSEKHKWTFLMEDDIFVKPGWFEYWTQWTTKENPDNKEYLLVNSEGYCLSLFSKEIFDVQQFDEGFCDGEYDDTDYAEQLIRKGYEDRIKEIKYDEKFFIHDYISSHQSLTALHGILSEKYYIEKYGISPDPRDKKYLHIGYHTEKSDSDSIKIDIKIDNIRPTNYDDIYTFLDTKPDCYYRKILISTLDGIEFIPWKFIRILEHGGEFIAPERYLSDKVMTDSNLFLYEKHSVCIRHVM